MHSAFRILQCAGEFTGPTYDPSPMEFGSEGHCGGLISEASGRDILIILPKPAPHDLWNAKPGTQARDIKHCSGQPVFNPRYNICDHGGDFAFFAPIRPKGKFLLQIRKIPLIDRE